MVHEFLARHARTSLSPTLCVSHYVHPHLLTSLPQLTWVISTLAMATAQKFLPMEQWVPFFTAIGAVAGCALNVAAKKRMAIAGAAAAKAKRDAEKKE